MFSERFRLKKGEAGINEILKWVLYIGIVIVAGFAIKGIVGKFSG